MSGTTTMPLFTYDPRIGRAVAVGDLQGRSLAYVEGYTVGCETLVGCAGKMGKLSANVIFAALDAMYKQPSQDIATYLFQKLRLYRRYVPEHAELVAGKYKHDLRPNDLPAFRPTSKASDPDFQAGQAAGTEALTTYYQLLLSHFQGAYATLPPASALWPEESEPTPTLPNGKPVPDIELTMRSRIVKYLRERDAHQAKLEAEMRTAVKPAVVAPARA
jgi:hypothetical protein